MSLVDRYIAKIFVGFFLGGLIVFVTIFLAVDVLSFAVRFSEAGPALLLKYYLYLLPTIIYQMIPVASLLATVFTISSLNRNSELVAMFSLGLSLARVSAPILVLVSLISGFAFWMSDRILPRVEQKKNYVYYVEIQQKPGLYSTVTTSKIWYRSENVLFNIKTLDPEKKRAAGITLYYFDDSWRLVQMISAASVKLAESRWTLNKGQVTLFDETSSFPLTQAFDSKVITMNEDIADLKSSAKATDVLSLKDLSRYIKKNRDAGLETTKFEVDYHSKFGFAFAAFVMSLMGLPFSVSKQRSGSSFANLGLCIGLAFIYWTLYSSALTLGRHGVIYPALAAWAPNLIMLVFSFYFLLRLRR